MSQRDSFIILTVPHAQCDDRARSLLGGSSRTCDTAALPMAREIFKNLEKLQKGATTIVASKQNRHLYVDDNRPVALLSRSPFWEDLLREIRSHLQGEKTRVIVLDVHSYDAGLPTSEACAVLDSGDDLGSFGRELCDTINDAKLGCDPMTLKAGQNAVNEMMRTTVSHSSLLEVSEVKCLGPDGQLNAKGRAIAATVAKFLHSKRSGGHSRTLEGLGHLLPRSQILDRF